MRLRQVALALLALSAACGRVAATKACNASDQDLWQWLAKGGAQLSIEPGVGMSGVRGAVASSDIPAGGLIASVPLRLTIQFRPLTSHDSLLAVAEWVALEARNASSAYAPYLASMPALQDAGHTLSYETFPVAYLHLLQDGGPLADHIINKRAATRSYWARHGARLAQAGVTLDGLRAAVVALTTRYFNGPGRAAMVPAYDLLNHVNGCLTYAATEPCAPGGDAGGAGPAAGGEQCIAIRTRVAVAKGAEVCNTYGWLAPDHLAFHYGFLPDGDALEWTGQGARPPAERAVPPLSRVDRPGFTLAGMSTTDRAPPTAFNGTGPELETERARLQDVLDRLREGQAAAEAARADPQEDPSGEKLGVVLAWRRQRQAALAAEVDRLAAAAAVAGTGTEGAPPQATQPRAAVGAQAGKKKRRRRRKGASPAVGGVSSAGGATGAREGSDGGGSNVPGARSQS